MKIAVIGSGISGLAAAYYLSKKHKVDLLEQDDHFGGHSYTYDIKEDNKVTSVDLGFIVFNEQTYPNLIKFFHELEVPFEKSNMSFAVSIKNTNVEYGGSGLNAIFANKKNLFNIKFLKMINEIVSFYKKAPLLLSQNVKEDTLGEFLNKSKLSTYFIEYHIIPMVAAIWSMPFEKAKDMPLKLFLNFFINHGLFKLKNRPQWYTVYKRSKTYVDKIINQVSGEYFKNYPINKITRNTRGIKIYYGVENEFFNYDKVVVATHADDALKLIEKPTSDELRILKNFKYRNNVAIIHSDDSIMPKNRKNWCSWNSSMHKKNTDNTSVTYWLNQLQNLNTNTNIFLTINPFSEISENKIFKKVKFTHPYFDNQALDHQNQLNLIQNKENILFCGSYFGYGFHEDGLKSSIEMMKSIND